MCVIAVSGPSFAGKTFLIAKLVNDFPDLRVINFEKHRHVINIADAYLSLYNDVQSYVDKGYSVIMEAVHSPIANPVAKRRVFNECIDIVCYPPFQLHQRYATTYLNKFGRMLYERRTAGASIALLRAKFKELLPSKYILFNGSNYNTVKDQLRGFINVDNGQHYDTEKE